MMKRIALLTAFLTAAVGGGYLAYPDEFRSAMSMATHGVLWLWENTKANPVPVALALGTFLLTVIYHKAKGKSLRESVEVAATRVAVIPAPSRESAENENRVVKRARARATRSQLLTDQIALQNRQRRLPEEIVKAEKEACYSEQAVADARRKLTERQKIHDEAVARLAAIRQEKADGEAELTAIEVELQKLAELV